jgi:hypothetical protein
VDLETTKIVTLVVSHTTSGDRSLSDTQKKEKNTWATSASHLTREISCGGEGEEECHEPSS